MKKITLIVALAALVFSCSKDGKSCGSYNGNTLYKGEDGGCYYINGNGNKTYVDRNQCNC